ncbi:MAG: response regulator [Actinophytocola sp.]|nr:response regulator [Actinophytocola sp.]
MTIIEPRGSRVVNIGVVDTVPLFRDGVAALIERTPWARLAAHSASRQGALLMIEQLHPDIVLLDSGLAPGGELVQIIAGGHSGPRVVVIVREAEQTPRYLANSMAMGAFGAVPRTAEPHRLIEAVRHACCSRRYLDPVLTSLITSADGRPASRASPAEQGQDTPQTRTLSRREFQVMQLIAEGMENAAIAKVLVLSVETVRTHVKSILRKLSARDRTHAVTIAFRSGLLSMSPCVVEQADAPVVASTRRPGRVVV